MAFCSKCGNALKENDLFCTNCGSKINKVITKNNLDPFECFVSGIKKYFTFSGCSTRKEFWIYLVYVFILQMTFVAVAIIDFIKMPNGLLQEAFGTTFSPAAIVNLILFYLSFLFFIIPTISIWVRRLHDINKSGWFVLCPIANIFFLFLKSKKENNKYNENNCHSKKIYL